MTTTIRSRSIDDEVKSISNILPVRVGMENSFHKAIIAHYIPIPIHSDNCAIQL